jgi:hypothetical protein
MLCEVVDFFILLIRSNSTPTCFGIWLPSSGGRECLISYPSGVLCNGSVRIVTGPVWSVVAVFGGTGHCFTGNVLHLN